MGGIFVQQKNLKALKNVCCSFYLLTDVEIEFWLQLYKMVLIFTSNWLLSLASAIKFQILCFSLKMRMSYRYTHARAYQTRHVNGILSHTAKKWKGKKSGDVSHTELDKSLDLFSTF